MNKILKSSSNGTHYTKVVLCTGPIIILNEDHRFRKYELAVISCIHTTHTIKACERERDNTEVIMNVIMIWERSQGLSSRARSRR